MSIYPVKLSEWYPAGDEQHSICYSVVKFSRCHACDSRLRWKSVVGHHSVPWGYGELWCNWKCCHSGRKAKPDWRRERRMKRRFEGIESLYTGDKASDYFVLDFFKK